MPEAQTLRRLEAQFNHALDATVLIDGQARLLEINPAACLLFGASPRILLGKSLRGLMRVSLRQWSAFLGKGAERCDHVLSRRDGTKVQTECEAVADIVPGVHMVVLRDVTASRAAAAALAESEEKYRRLVDASPDAVVIHSRGRLVFVNPAALRLFGAASAGQLLGRKVMSLVHPDFRPVVSERLRRLRGGHNAAALKEKLLRLDGCEIDVEAAATPTKFAGRPAVQVIVRDVTERLKAEEALRESEERLRLLVEGVRDYALFMLDAEAHVASWNGGAQRILGYPALEAMGLAFGAFFSARDWTAERVTRKLRQARLDGRFEKESWFVRRDGSRFLANFILTAVRTETGSLKGYAAVVRDVTTLRQLERDMTDLAAREQRRLGQDLHDGLGQHLTGLALLSKALAGRLAKSAPEAAKEAQRIAALARDAIIQTRALSRGLDPVERGPAGLAAAFEGLALSASGLLGIDCVFRGPGAVPVPDFAQSVQLFRIAQEAVNNAAKHGKAGKVVITLSGAEGSLQLAVRDDGKGFDPKPGGRRGMGLQSMEYRARMMGGTLAIKSNEDGGATLVCSCPIQEAPGQPGRKR